MTSGTQRRGVRRTAPILGLGLLLVGCTHVQPPRKTEPVREYRRPTPTLVDVTVTSITEQRSTEWMRFHSLSDFLDPGDNSLSIEGHPAPRRAIVTARAP